MEKMEKIWLGFLGVVVIGLLVYTGVRDWRGINKYQKMRLDIEKEEPVIRKKLGKIDEYIVKGKVFTEMGKYREAKKMFESAQVVLKELMGNKALKKYHLEDVYNFCEKNIQYLSNLSAK